MLIQLTSKQFERDYVKQFKWQKDLDKLKRMMRLIIEEVPLDKKYRDHPLSGNWSKYRDCHIEPDWLLRKIPSSKGIFLCKSSKVLPTNNFIIVI